MMPSERSLVIVCNHEPESVPAEVYAAATTAVVALVLSTFRSDDVDMVLDRELWLTCMRAVATASNATSSEVFLYAESRFLEALRRPRRGRSAGSLEKFVARPSSDEPDEAWSMIIWRNGPRVVAAATCERWYRVGGPSPYHDSYTTSVFVKPEDVETLIDSVRRGVDGLGGRVERVLASPSEI